MDDYIGKGGVNPCLVKAKVKAKQRWNSWIPSCICISFAFFYKEKTKIEFALYFLIVEGSTGGAQSCKVWIQFYLYLYLVCICIGCEFDKDYFLLLQTLNSKLQSYLCLVCICICISKDNIGWVGAKVKAKQSCKGWIPSSTIHRIPLTKVIWLVIVIYVWCSFKSPKISQRLHPRIDVKRWK